MGWGGGGRGQKWKTFLKEKQKAPQKAKGQ